MSDPFSELILFFTLAVVLPETRIPQLDTGLPMTEYGIPCTLMVISLLYNLDTCSDAATWVHDKTCLRDALRRVNRSWKVKKFALLKVHNDKTALLTLVAWTV